MIIIYFYGINTILQVSRESHLEEGIEWHSCSVMRVYSTFMKVSDIFQSIYTHNTQFQILLIFAILDVEQC